MNKEQLIVDIIVAIFQVAMEALVQIALYFYDKSRKK